MLGWLTALTDIRCYRGWVFVCSFDVFSSHQTNLYYFVCGLVGARRGRVSIRLIDKNLESECGFESVSVKLTTKAIMLPVDAKP